MEISAEKTKIMTNSKEPSKKEIKVKGQILESVTKFKYLGSIISDEGSKPEILSRIVQTTAAMTKLKPIWNNKNIAISSKIRLLRCLVMLIFLYACESWTLNADIERTIRAREMRCNRRLLGISYKDHITNEEVSRRIENAIGLHVDLLTIVRQRKLKWYGHTTRSSGLAKTIMQRTVNGGRRRGRQKKRWEDNIREWTGLELRNTLRKAEDREEWKAVVRRPSAAARRIPSLKDR
ncbi:endonuclease-reverse transcriptase [Plakobranchus ocellatus]|uniref:Endonuclease-reverse transcriptase n=1 Tax=Plakobranchus ocellatus TaxID=259542 RepID=A0AAV3ZSU2_9GAST|nr:endonuclease-reverse transcriptase [Plakobranchus ocellatus]